MMCRDTLNPLAPPRVMADDGDRSRRNCVNASSVDDDFDDEVFPGLDGGDEVTSSRRLSRHSRQNAPGTASDVSADSCYGDSVSSRTESESNSPDFHTVEVRLISRRQQSKESVLRPAGVASLPDGESCRFRLKRLLGAGAFGRVYLCGCCRCAAVSPRDVAVKMLRGQSIDDSLRSETNALNFDHENVAAVLGAGWVTTRHSSDDVAGDDDDVDLERCCCRRRASSWIPKVAAVLMEFVDGRNLQTIIDDKCEAIDFNRRARFAHDITSALAYIHSRSVVHLDVKPANVLVTAAEDRCKLTDFGCSLHLADEPNDSAGLFPSSSAAPPSNTASLRRCGGGGGGGTVVYSAPELFQTDDLRQSGKSLVKADIYSLGVTLWQLAARRYPFDEYRFSACAVIYAVVEFGARPDGTGYDACGLPPPSTCPTVPLTVTEDAEIDYVKTYSKCWRDEPDARPTTADLVPLFDVWRRHRRN